MFEQDYIMRLFINFAKAIRRSMEQANGQKDPVTAAEMLEEAIGQATEIDNEVFLSLAPESMSSILQVSGTDPRVIEYIARSLLLEASYLREGGKPELAALRESQAHGLAGGFGMEVSIEELSEEDFEAFFAEHENQVQ